LNCFVSHEILILLRGHNAIRCDPPSLLRVTLQATAVYLFSIIVFIIHYFITRAIFKAYAFEGNRLRTADLCWSLLVSYIFPISFFVYVWITIKCRGYMPSATGRMDKLVRIPFYTARYFLLSSYKTLIARNDLPI
jgi:hypothetical protein